MGTETRIGIATGLLIVVVASVYFFYGSDRSAEDLLIATGGPAAEPPKIPADHGDRLASSGRQRPEPAPRQAATSPQRATETSARSASRSSDNQPQWKSPALATRRNQSPVGRRFTGSTKPQVGTGAAIVVPAQRGSKKPPATHQRRLPLRTGPSQALVEATRNNAHPQSLKRPSGQTERKNASQRPAASPRKPAVSWPTRHKISAGDTLSDISFRYYATSNQVKHILGANPGIKNPKALKIGDILIIPAPAPITQANAADKRRGDPSQPRAGERRTSDSGRSPGSAASTDRRYRVRSGDTLYRIARKKLGDPSRWKEIYDRNRTVIGKDPLRLQPGMMLTLPG